MIRPTVTISITGKWKTKEMLMKDIVEKSGGYEIKGDLLYYPERDLVYEVKIKNGEKSSQHTYIIVITTETMGMGNVQKIIEVGAALLASGGTSIQIDTSGVVYKKEAWEELSNQMDPLMIFVHFVTLGGDKNGYHSVGMKSFDLPDTLISSSVQEEEAIHMMNNFNYYNLMEHPVFKTGHTFALEENGPMYQMTWQKDKRYEKKDIFYNPSGIWELKKIR